MAYPSSIDSFANPSGTDDVSVVDHAAQHTAHNTAISSIEAVLGTNSGTSILKNFTAGVFAAKQNSETMGSLTVNKGTITGGLFTGGTVTTGTVTASNFTSGTLTNPVMTGGTSTSTTFTTPIMGSWDGWQLDSDTWTYVSASAFKIVGKDVTARFPRGTKIKLTDSTVKYFYVTATSFSADTSVTITGGSDYSLSGGALSANYYSYGNTPQGFPDWFNWTPVWNNVTVGSGTNIGRFCLIGKTVHMRAELTFGTSTVVTSGVTLDGPVGYYSGGLVPIGKAIYYDNGLDTYMGHLNLSAELIAETAGSTYINRQVIDATHPFTWTTSDYMKVTATYESG